MTTLNFLLLIAVVIILGIIVYYSVKKYFKLNNKTIQDDIFVRNGHLSKRFSSDEPDFKDIPSFPYPISGSPTSLPKYPPTSHDEVIDVAKKTSMILPVDEQNSKDYDLVPPAITAKIITDEDIIRATTKKQYVEDVPVMPYPGHSETDHSFIQESTENTADQDLNEMDDLDESIAILGEKIKILDQQIKARETENANNSCESSAPIIDADKAKLLGMEKAFAEIDLQSVVVYHLNNGDVMKIPTGIPAFLMTYIEPFLEELATKIQWSQKFKKAFKKEKFIQKYVTDITFELLHSNEGSEVIQETIQRILETTIECNK